MERRSTRIRSVKKLKNYVLAEAFSDLDDAIIALLDSYNMERSLNELRSPLIDDLEYYEKELEISELFNLILILKQIKNRRTHGTENP